MWGVQWCALMVLLAGCATPATPNPEAPTALTSGDPVVIALIDTGTNPYMDAFLQAAPPVLPGVESRMVDLADTGDLRARLDADAAFWENAEPRVLYQFAGTRLLAISFTDQARWTLFDSYGHGAGVTALAAREGLNTVIVSVQVHPQSCPPPETCLIDASVAEAMAWVSEQPWIDIVSSSIGFQGNPPFRREAHPEINAWVAANEAAANAGKVVVNSAGNYVAPSVGHSYGGPPWVIAVGGVQRDAGGDAVPASKGVDVAANYSEYLQSPELDGSEWEVGGTSFAAPIVAGTLGQALHLARTAAPGQTIAATDLRAALNASALTLDPAKWRPAVSAEDWRYTLTHTSLPPLTPAQTGWGYVNGSLAPEIARRVLEGDLQIPAEKETTALFQAQWQAAREEYWRTGAR